MPTVAALIPHASFLSRPRPPPPPLVTYPTSSISVRRWLHVPSPIAPFGPAKPRSLVTVACSAAPFNEFDAKVGSKSQLSKKFLLLNLIKGIEPLDVSLIQKDVPADTVDAMKRTISDILGVLPSNKFRVIVEALSESVFSLLVSSIKTGYTLRNAEYRLHLEKNFDISEKHTENREKDTLENGNHEVLIDRTSKMSNSFGECDGEMTPEVRRYIQYLQSRLNSVEKELHDIKRKNSALQMQVVGEEKNELLDYLRSLQPEMVVELSEPTGLGVEEAIRSFAHDLLAVLSAKMHPEPPHHPKNMTGGTLNFRKDDYREFGENTSIRFQPLISLSRDYLAHLLFWCMLLGHYLRGIEYQLELMQIFGVSGEAS
ncbi:hypothetical protein Cni_G08357 [Canna indica]|uniref:Uncharacterized protein n=1 Tax=Canna indica TaxID=4628 RepID=A0AAQ3Q5P7_9LILI|nr:hypothetical protein Cni_G08357 [Canna indica]